MTALPSGADRSWPPSPRATDQSAHRRTISRVAGIVIAIAGLAGLATLDLLGGPHAAVSVDVIGVVIVCFGVACALVRWDKHPAWWLHVIPLVATAGVAVSIRLAGLYGDIATDYYILIAVFAAYAFSSRTAVAVHVALAAAAAALPLLYTHPPSRTPARTVVVVMLLVAIAAIVTVLREGLERRQRELEELATRDPLTGVGNYRLLSARLDYELARHRRTGSALSVLLLDLDGFKEINDTFGHLVGDRVLIEVARAVAASVRVADTLARQGGDEFSILAPDTGNQGARVIARRVQQAVATATSNSVTTSIGWATFPADADDAVTLLALADADLRRAKRERGADLGARSAVAPAPAAILRLVEAAAV